MAGQAPLSLDEHIAKIVEAAVERRIDRYLSRLGHPEPRVYNVRETADVLPTSTKTVRRLLSDGILPTVPHMGERTLVGAIGMPRLGSIRRVRLGEHEAVAAQTNPSGQSAFGIASTVGFQDVDRAWIQGDAVVPVGLGALLHDTAAHSSVCSCEDHRARVEVETAPTQRHKLAAPSSQSLR
jgi:hypothetical protein